MQNLKTYKKIKEEQAHWNKIAEIADKLVIFGVKKSSIDTFKLPIPISGYSMGEMVIYKCNGTVFHEIDNRQYYAKSCKWKEKHGHIVFDFSKAQLKRMGDIWFFLSQSIGTEDRIVLVEEMKEILRKALVKKTSVLKDGYHSWSTSKYICEL